MTEQIQDPKLREIARRLVAAYAPERVYLFGSMARGDAGPDSDYDLLLVVPDDAPAERRRSRLAYEVLWGIGAAADVLVWTKTRFDARAHVVASLPATVLREGRLLHPEQDPELVAETKEWLAKARMDIDVAAFELTAQPPFVADIAFHSQQAVEKSLKGYLAWNSLVFSRLRDLGELVEKCASVDRTLAPPLQRASRMSEYAWRYRYPGDPVLPTVDVASAALETARDIHAAILARLPAEAHP